MMTVPVRETPAPSPLHRGPDPSHPKVRAEPVLRVEQIQGNIVPGFNKDFQELLFLRIGDDVAGFKRWLATLVPLIATTDEVLAFNRLYKKMAARWQREGAIKATWVNVAFSFPGLRRLSDEAERFRDRAFRAGLAARSAGLGDPTDEAAEGHPSHWKVGGPDKEADLVLIVASDDEDDLSAEAQRLEDSLRAAGEPAEVFHRERGATLPGPLRGHEHFGFLDGVSQPGLRGRISKALDDVLMPRQNPSDRDQGKPGQDLLWPGAFIFGYPGQKRDSVTERGARREAGPSWGDDGSFLVFRRLRQDVPAFRRFVHDNAWPRGLSDELLGAKLVGRWRSGAPVLRAATADVAGLGDDDCANNHFEFRDASQQLLPADQKSAEDCTDRIPGTNPAQFFAASPGDKEGKICPFAGHIRKAYPRDDLNSGEGTAEEGDREPEVQRHRLLRRGIPFGRPYPDSEEERATDDGDRGLLFLAYQTSIVEQFEYVTKRQVNDPNFKAAGAGHDPIIGQNGAPAEGRRRTFAVTYRAADGTERTDELSTTVDWVIPTGGGYFFAPSIHALETLSQ